MVLPSIFINTSYRGSVTPACRQFSKWHQKRVDVHPIFFRKLARELERAARTFEGLNDTAELTSSKRADAFKHFINVVRPLFGRADISVRSVVLNDHG
jgi:hypothetical protein